MVIHGWKLGVGLGDCLGVRAGGCRKRGCGSGVGTCGGREGYKKRDVRDGNGKGKKKEGDTRVDFVFENQERVQCMLGGGAGEILFALGFMFVCLF